MSLILESSFHESEKSIYMFSCVFQKSLNVVYHHLLVYIYLGEMSFIYVHIRVKKKSLIIFWIDTGESIYGCQREHRAET